MFTLWAYAVKYYIGSIALYDGETLVLRKVDQKYLENFEMWLWRRMENISWTDCAINEGVLRSQEREDYPTCNKKSECN
jgi:hypothetical protein